MSLNLNFYSPDFYNIVSMAEISMMIQKLQTSVLEN